MKQHAILLTVLALSLTNSLLSAQVMKDTTFTFNQKQIHIQDSIDQINIRISSREGDSYKKVYEGIFSDGKSFERFNVVQDWGISIPFTKRKQKKHTLEAHWAGFGIGVLTLSDNRMHIGISPGFPIDRGKSTEITWNIIEGLLPIFGNSFGITSGFGLNWRNFHLEGNKHLLEVNDVTAAYPAPAGVTYKYSRLRMLHLTMPLLLEWQPLWAGKRRFYVTAGAVAGWNVNATYRVKYDIASGKEFNEVESRGLKTNPLTLDLIGQIGYNCISFYAKYAPVGVFQNGKGPEVHAASLGMMLHF